MTAELSLGDGLDLFQRIRSDASRLLCRVGGRRDGPCYNASLIAGRAIADLGSTDRPGRLSNPGPGWCGGWLESVYCVTPQGSIVVHEYRLPPWNWHEGPRAVIANLRGNGARRQGSFGGERALRSGYEMWNGIGPLYYSETEFEDEGLRDLGVCVATRYRTTRKGKLEHYVHVHSRGVRAYESPHHVVVRGGRLDATPEGLIN